MAELANNIRLAVDSGKVALGMNKVMDTLRNNSAKLVIIAAKSRPDVLEDIQHTAKISNAKLVLYQGDSMELGAICGKPFSVSVLSIIEEGNSKILEES